MRWFKSLLKGFTFSTMGATALALAGGIGCGDESFKFCECRYACTGNYPSPADPATMTTSPVDLIVCDEGDGGYTYGDCGVFCKTTFPTATLPTVETTPLCACYSPGCGTTCYKSVPGVIGAPTVATLTGCTAEPAETLAKNSCSPGTPVGD